MTTTLLRHSYIECHEGSSFKFHQIVMTTDGAGNYTVANCYGRIGANGTESTKYAGADLAKAASAFDATLREKLRKGYFETPARAGALDYLRRKGGRAWDLDPALEPLRRVTALGRDEIAQLDAGWLTEAAPSAGTESGAFALTVPESGAWRAEAVRGDAWHRSPALGALANAIRDAGLAPALVEVAYVTDPGGRTMQQVLVDVWMLRGEDCTAMPGAERIMLRAQVAALRDGIAQPVPAAPAAALWAIELGTGERGAVAA